MALSLAKLRDHAVALTLLATTPAEHTQAHLAMRRAWPGLARSYPCRCAACVRVESARRPKAIRP